MISASIQNTVVAINALLDNHLVMIITAIITCRVCLFNLHALSLEQLLVMLFHLFLGHRYIFSYLTNGKTKASRGEVLLTEFT